MAVCLGPVYHLRLGLLMGGGLGRGGVRLRMVWRFALLLVGPSRMRVVLLKVL